MSLASRRGVARESFLGIHFGGRLGAAAALGIVPGRVVARRPVWIWLVRSVVGVKYALTRHSAVTMRGTSIVNFRFSSHLCVPLVQRLKRHGLCRCCDRQGEHYGEKPHYSSPLANAAFVCGAHSLFHFSTSSRRYSSAVRAPRRSRISFSLTPLIRHSRRISMKRDLCSPQSRGLALLGHSF
jgi:hypothetical protein